MINDDFLNYKPISTDFLCFLERRYPEEYQIAVKKQFDKIPGYCWSEFWKAIYAKDKDAYAPST